MINQILAIGRMSRTLITMITSLLLALSISMAFIYFLLTGFIKYFS